MNGSCYHDKLLAFLGLALMTSAAAEQATCYGILRASTFCHVVLEKEVKVRIWPLFSAAHQASPPVSLS